MSQDGRVTYFILVDSQSWHLLYRFTLTLRISNCEGFDQMFLKIFGIIECFVGSGNRLQLSSVMNSIQFVHSLSSFKRRDESPWAAYGKRYSFPSLFEWLEVALV